MLQRILLLAACAFALTSCSDSTSTPQGTRSVAAPVAGVAPAQPNAPALKPPPIPAAPQVSARGYYLMDFTSGQVLAEMPPHEARDPGYQRSHRGTPSRLVASGEWRVASH